MFFEALCAEFSEYSVWASVRCFFLAVDFSFLIVDNFCSVAECFVFAFPGQVFGVVSVAVPSSHVEDDFFV